MQRADEVLTDPQLTYRRVLTEMAHPCFGDAAGEAGPAPYRNIPPARQCPALLPGADTRRICRDVLAMSAQETDRLIAAGVLFAAADDPAGAAREESSHDCQDPATAVHRREFRIADKAEPVLEAATGELLGDGGSAAGPISTPRSPRPGRHCRSGRWHPRTTAPLSCGPSPRRCANARTPPTNW